MHEISENLLLKISKADQKSKENLLRIARDEIFKKDEKLFDLVLSQTSIHSQNTIYKAIKQGVDSKIMYHLIKNTNGYIKQERILKYSNCKAIFENELILIDMLNIENEYVENELYQLFRMNKIRNIEEYKEKKNYYSGFAKFKKLIKKDVRIFSEMDYEILKQNRILRDNVLKDTKKTLRNFGFLGIDIPRINDQNQKKNDIVKSFDNGDYQKLFNVDDFGSERLFINGTITNAKSDLNFVELVVIMKKILKKYDLTNYNIDIYDEELYKKVCNYSKENTSLISSDSSIIKFDTNNNEEFVNISRYKEDITFNIKIDKLVDYLVSEKKENNVTEDNLRDTLIYIANGENNDKKLYEVLYDKYLYDYHAIIVYEEDLPKDKLCEYCINNNIKFVGFLENRDNFNIVNSEELIHDSKYKKSKKLELKFDKEGEK